MREKVFSAFPLKTSFPVKDELPAGYTRQSGNCCTGFS